MATVKEKIQTGEIMENHIIAPIYKNHEEETQWNALLQEMNDAGISFSYGDLTEQLESFENQKYRYIYFPKDFSAEGMYVDRNNNTELKERVHTYCTKLIRDQVYPCVMCCQLPSRYSFPDGGTMYYSVGCGCKETKAYRSSGAEGTWNGSLYKSTERTPNEDRPSWQSRNGKAIIV